MNFIIPESQKRRLIVLDEDLRFPTLFDPGNMNVLGIRFKAHRDYDIVCYDYYDLLKSNGYCPNLTNMMGLHRQLRKENMDNIIKKAQEEYDKGNPIMSDDAFDVLTGDESQFDKVEGTYTVKHYKQMGSISKVRSEKDLLKLMPTEGFLVQPKFDGISCEIILKDGYIQSISTRGNGEYGKDLNSVYSAGFLKNTTWNNELKAIYGEIVLHNYEPSQKDRNIVAGICNKDNPTYEEVLSLRLCVYEAYYTSGERVSLDTLQNIYLCNSQYVYNSKCLICNIYTDIDDIVEYFDSYYDYIKRDGIVAKYRSIYQTSIDKDDEIEIALKPEPLSAVTKLVNVEWSRGKSNFNAVAIIDPVVLGGVTISRVTLPESYITKMNLRIGDIIEITRSGDVIPKIIGVVQHNGGELIVKPNTCHCGSELETYKKVLVCTKENCEYTERSFLYKISETLFWGMKRPPRSKIHKLISTGAVTLNNIDDTEYMAELLTQREYSMYSEGLLNFKDNPLRKLLYSFNVDQMSERKQINYIETYSKDVFKQNSDELLSSVNKIYSSSENIRKFVEKYV